MCIGSRIFDWYGAERLESGPEGAGGTRQGMRVAETVKCRQGGERVNRAGGKRMRSVGEESIGMD